MFRQAEVGDDRGYHNDPEVVCEHETPNTARFISVDRLRFDADDNRMKRAPQTGSEKRTGKNI